MPDPYETVAVSGGMDPVHKGHVRMIQEASQFGEVIVILNSDEWLMRKKGFVFMSFILWVLSVDLTFLVTVSYLVGIL